MRTLCCLLAAALIAASPAQARPKHVEWKAWNDGLKAADHSGRYVLVDVYTDWCGWCRTMDDQVYSNADVASYLAGHFVPVKLNAESGELVTWEGRNSSARTLASEFHVRGFPTTIFLTSKGEHMVNVPGFVPADRFLLLLRFIAEGHAEGGESFDDFVSHAKEPR